MNKDINKKTRLSVRVTDEELGILKKQAKIKKLTMSEFIRRALNLKGEFK